MPENVKSECFSPTVKRERLPPTAIHGGVCVMDDDARALEIFAYLRNHHAMHSALSTMYVDYLRESLGLSYRQASILRTCKDNDEAWKLARSMTPDPDPIPKQSNDPGRTVFINPRVKGKTVESECLNTNRDVVDEADPLEPVTYECPFCWDHGTYENYNPEAGGIVTEFCHCDKGERMRNDYEADQVDYETRRLER